MSTTAQQIHNRAIAIMDELSSTGTIDADATKDYGYRAPYLLDMWQKEMVKNGDYFASYEKSCFRKANLLGDLVSFDAIENIGTAQVYTGKAANCFYIEVDGDCEITLQEDGVDITGSYSFNDGTATAFTTTISVTMPADSTSFVSLRGTFTATGTVTMSVNGSYYFRHCNRALSVYKYSASTLVPDFKPWYKLTMPDAFKSRTQVIEEYPKWQYDVNPITKWENNNELYVSFGYTGIVRVNYIPVPTEITALAQTLEVDDITAQSGAFYLAEHYALADQNEDLATVFRNKFQSLKFESMGKIPFSNEQIIDVYGG